VLGLILRLDVGGRRGYARAVTEARAVEQTHTPSDVERDRQELIAAIEDGLADLDAGRTFTHAEVMAEMRRRFPPPTK
jgi:predicted transcriptional regulator